MKIWKLYKKIFVRVRIIEERNEFLPNKENCIIVLYKINKLFCCQLHNEIPGKYILYFHIE